MRCTPYLVALAAATAAGLHLTAAAALAVPKVAVLSP
jgi:hypothetical protein